MHSCSSLIVLNEPTGTMFLGTTTGVMFGLRDRQQFRKALGLPQFTDNAETPLNDQQTEFGVSTQLLKLEQKLGEGQFGDVYSCSFKGQKMCAKEPKLTKRLDIVKEHLDVVQVAYDCSVAVVVDFCFCFF
jgi:hypothetical protein